MLALVVALVAATGAFADAPASPPSVAQNSNFHPMQCLGAGTGFAGMMTTTFSVRAAGGHGRTTLSGNVKAGLVFTYEANDPSQPSYIGLQAINQALSVPVASPATVTSVDFPVTVPVLGSDGSVSEVATTATATFTPANGHNYDGDLTIGSDFDCVDGALQPAVMPIPATTQAALVTLIDSASQAGASGALATAIADRSSSRALAPLTALTSPSSVRLIDTVLGSPWIVPQLNAITNFFDQLNAAPVAATN